MNTKISKAWWRGPYLSLNLVPTKTLQEILLQAHWGNVDQMGYVEGICQEGWTEAALALTGCLLPNSAPPHALIPASAFTPTRCLTSGLPGLLLKLKADKGPV